MRVSSPPVRLARALARSAHGNVAILSAFAVIPLLAMVGGAVDASRTYMAYTRLQQACDSAALAGRKAMGNVTRLTTDEQAKANEFFDFNFPARTYAAEDIRRTFAKGADGVVVGAASLSMPTTLMKVFGFGAIPLKVTCQATLNIPNTDVMFVLDVTGSMAATPAGYTTSDPTQTRLYGLKQAVKDFYAALGPGTASGPGRIRYGFVPYSMNVNVGRILYDSDPGYVVGGRGPEDHDYQSRIASTEWRYGREYAAGWSYVQRRFDVSPFVRTRDTVANPVFWSGGFTNGASNGGAPSRFAWGGCIEEATTVNWITSSSSIERPAAAYDLDVDLVPNSAQTRWRPYLRELQYLRDGTWLGQVRGDLSACPSEARKLEQYAGDYNSLSKSSARFSDYVDGLDVGGFTYHDIGLVWGARFLSPDGIFARENADSAAPGGYQVSRHIVFMTDGQQNTLRNNNDAWGINILDGRIARTWADEDSVEASHTRRTEIICNLLQGKGFTVWIVGFGVSDLPAHLKRCASGGINGGHWSVATDTKQLRASFAQIAQTVGGLRLSQ